MQLVPLAVQCPSCKSIEVTYSCHPDCCFNHVCDSCLNSFELFTEDAGATLSPVAFNGNKRDSCAPTVACARCESLNVYSLSGEPADRLACASCGAALLLKIL
jgi:hypothetical protein